MLLVDLQEDFLGRGWMTPPRDSLLAAARALLDRWRASAWPVAHVRMSTTLDPDNRLPHWKERGLAPCLVGTRGHAFPGVLEPLPSEPVINKRGYSAFSEAATENWLAESGATSVVIAGLFLHQCIRATAMDARARGWTPRIVLSATASYDALQGEMARAEMEYLGIHAFDEEPPIAEAGRATISEAVERARLAGRHLLRSGTEERATWLRVARERLRQPGVSEGLARLITRTVGKPIRAARAEVRRAIDLLEMAPVPADAGSRVPLAGGWSTRRLPVGPLAMVTPWNHPLAIAIGKIAPAVWFGNPVIWKPSPAGTPVAEAVAGLLLEAGWPEGLVELVPGGASTARALMEADGIGAITLTGGIGAGAAAARIAMRRHLPLQAELGGNNPSVIWEPPSLADALAGVARSAFGFAGQRCTANRRVIVPAGQFDACLAGLVEATAALSWESPEEESCDIGPLISQAAVDDLEARIHGARARGMTVVRPHAAAAISPPVGAAFAPAIIAADDPSDDIVRHENFGPVLVVQRAHSPEEAIALADRGDHGLVASLYTTDDLMWQSFRDSVRAGLLKRNAATADAGIDAPFGGWKSSAHGPPEHGAANIEFHTRFQSLHGDE